MEVWLSVWCGMIYEGIGGCGVYRCGICVVCICVWKVWF